MYQLLLQPLAAQRKFPLSFIAAAWDHPQLCCCCRVWVSCLNYFPLLCNHRCQNGALVFLGRQLSNLCLFTAPIPNLPAASHQGCILASLLYILLLSPGCTSSISKSKLPVLLQAADVGASCPGWGVLEGHHGFRGQYQNLCSQPGMKHHWKISD